MSFRSKTLRSTPCGIAHTQEEVTWLVTEIEKLKPFPDAVAALEKFRSKGYKLTILSNSDRDMLKTAGAAAVVWLAKSVSIA